MSDSFSDCLNSYVNQLKTLSQTTSFFPAQTGKLAGWQISEDDSVVNEGSDYFIIYRSGTFSKTAVSQMQDNVWKIPTWLFMRFDEYETVWSKFRVYRSKVLELPETKPLKEHGIYKQEFISTENPGYQKTEDGNYTGFVVQAMECTLSQRLLKARNY